MKQLKLVLSVFVFALLACNMPAIRWDNLALNGASTPSAQEVPLGGNPIVKLDVQLAYAEHRMQVHHTVDLINESADVWSEVVFNVPLGATPDAFRLEAVSVVLDDSIHIITSTFANSETVLRAPLPRGVAPGQAVQIVMAYEINIPPLSVNDVPPQGTTGWNEYLTQAGEWYPALVPYIDHTGWHTWSYAAMGDPTVYPIADYELIISTEPGITVVSGSPLDIDVDGIWRFAVRNARGIAFLASDQYALAQGEVSGKPIYSYYLAENAISGEAALEIASQAFSLYEELYGPYVYDSLTIAQSGFGGGMEYSALVTIAHNLYPAYDEDPTAMPSLLHLLIAHEVGHQWWYGGVGNDQVYEPWLDESLAFYSERLYLERYMPEIVELWWEYRTDGVSSPHTPIDGSIYDYELSSNPHATAYAHYGLFIHDLRTQMGDQAFFSFLQSYYQDYSGKIATGRDFRAVAKAYSLTDLTPLFQTYFRQSP